MAKTIKFNPKQEETKIPTPKNKIKEELQFKKQKFSTKRLSNKEIHGHFSKQHIWPFRNEDKKGRKV